MRRVLSLRAGSRAAAPAQPTSRAASGPGAVGRGGSGSSSVRSPYVATSASPSSGGCPFTSASLSVTSPPPVGEPGPSLLESAAAAGEVPPAPPTHASKRAPLPVRINDAWYDLSGWRQAHPAGTGWIDMFAGRDATEVIHAFHSDTAHIMLARLPKYSPPQEVLDAVPDVTPAQRAFRELRAKLLAENWFARNYWAEAAHLAAWASCVLLGVLAAHSAAAWARTLAFIPLGLSFTAAGWLAHDYIHGRGPFCTAMRHFGGWGAGFGATMWSDKHNRHHALTNEVGQDEDLSGGPVLFLWAPDPSRDKAWRAAQGVYYLAAFSLLHWVWRIDSLVVAVKRGPLWAELLPILGHYALYLSLVPLPTFVAAVFLGGFIMANIVTTSHQSEELLFSPEHDWVRMQFRTTRDAEPGNWFTSWLWGGMQHQLEHHLFPTMPRYRYPALIPIMKAFAAEHGLPYKSESDVAIWRRTWANYQRVAAEAAVEGSPGPRKGVTI